jgi:hypothetical protein
MLAAELHSFQIPLIEFVESDDLYLQQHEDILWFGILRDLDWRAFRPVAARYYEALWQFNVRQTQMRREREMTQPANPETQAEATRRLLFERATLCEDTPTLHELPASAPPQIQVDPQTLRPGTPPLRWAGKKPKCFFALFAAFLGVMFRGRPAEPEIVYEELRSNPSYARTCGFTMPRPDGQYRHTDVPSLRKLQQFDQIMTETGLWAQAKVEQVTRNFQAGRLHPESTLVHDTTHYTAFSGMQTVELPPAGGDVVPAEPKATLVAAAEHVPEASSQAGDDNAKPASKKAPKATKPRKKSHPKTTKRCRCKDRQHCPHPWVNADEGAGTVVKSTGKMYWAHKASTICLPGQEVLLDAVAMSDAASHDSQSLVPHLKRLFQLHPDLKPVVHRMLDDRAADDQKLKQTLQDDLGIELLASINPRNRQPLRDDLPRGMDHITPTGTPVCRAGYPFDFVGCRRDTERFLFRAPADAEGVAVCQACPLRPECYRGGDGARQITVPFERLPWIDPKFPQLSQRFARTMADRTAIERMHKLMKYDYGDEQLTKRGNAAFQARLDKTILAMHVVIAHR